jgi:hypothetical protein
MTSTRNLDLLPDIAALRRLTQSLAMLDAILCPEWEGRYYSFNSHWAQGEMMASMRDGQGDEWFLLFCQAGAVMKGFAHEAPMADGPPWAGVLSAVPPVFGRFLTEPAFSLQDATFCLWRTASDQRWHTGEVLYPPGLDPDGSADLLSILDGRPLTYQRWAEENYEVGVNIASVEHIYRQRPLTADVVATLSTGVTLDDLADDIAEIGYPSGAELSAV